MNFNHKAVEAIIGYTFNDKKLLKQAFTRSSYSNENGGEDNEVLEFIGNTVLDFAMIRIFKRLYMKVEKEGLVSSQDEGELTQLKAALVNKDVLSRTTESLGLSKYLLMGKNDENNNKNAKSPKEDLFEATLGAIAIDSNWDMEIITSLVDKLIKVETTIKTTYELWNCVEKLQKLLQKNKYKAPTYTYTKLDKQEWKCTGSIPALSLEYSTVSKDKKEAKQNAALLLLQHASPLLSESSNKENKIKAIIGEPSLKNALQQINRLVQSKTISQPKYEYSSSHGKNGNPIWACSCSVKQISGQSFSSSKKDYKNKKDAQRGATYALLSHLVKIGE